jgi:hypothetical protein
MLLLYISYALPTQSDVPSPIHHPLLLALTAVPPIERSLSWTTPSRLDRALPTYLFLAAVLEVKHYPMHTGGSKPRCGFVKSWTVDEGGDGKCLTRRRSPEPVPWSPERQYAFCG